MPDARHGRGEILLAALTFSGLERVKKRPVVVLRDVGDDDLLVLPVTSHSPRSGHDMLVIDWQGAGLKLPSVIRCEKIATIARSTVVRRLGRLAEGDWQVVVTGVRAVLAEVLA